MGGGDHVSGRCAHTQAGRAAACRPPLPASTGVSLRVAPSGAHPSVPTPRPHTRPPNRRWLTLALTQEFPFPDALRLWDSLLSDPAGRSDCLLRLCTAMLLHVRQELLQVGTALDAAMLACLPLPQYWPVDQAVSGSAASRGELSAPAGPSWAGCSSVCSWAS